MSIAMAFWVCFLIWTIFGVWAWWPINRTNGPNLLLWLLLFLLGCGQFGLPIKGL